MVLLTCLTLETGYQDWYTSFSSKTSTTCLPCHDGGLVVWVSGRKSEDGCKTHVKIEAASGDGS